MKNLKQMSDLVLSKDSLSTEYQGGYKDNTKKK